MNEIVVTHHVRHIFMPVDQIINKIYLQCNNLLNENNSIPQTVFAKNNQMTLIAYFKEKSNSLHLFIIFNFSLKKQNKSNSLLPSCSTEYTFLFIEIRYPIIAYMFL